jgi:hypothetical protein
MPDASAFVDMTSNPARCAAELLEVVRGLEADEAEPLRFDCMPDWDNATQLQDQRPWRESLPAKVGVYHAFMRTTAQNMREHKLFIVVSGHCRHASEELYNLWLDARDTITAQQFMECAEVDWLRKATLRNHNRLAARVAKRLGLSVRYMHDVDAVTSTRALLPHAIEEKVTFVPGDIYYADRADAATMRLSFSTPSPEQVREGVARLGRAIVRLHA